MLEKASVVECVYASTLACVAAGAVGTILTRQAECSWLCGGSFFLILHFKAAVLHALGGLWEDLVVMAMLAPARSFCTDSEKTFEGLGALERIWLAKETVLPPGPGVGAAVL
eukprot:scaffold132759_cov17-Tisochrysis_lutea.AAC.1